QGQTFLGSVDVTPDASGVASFSFTPASLPAGAVVTATATNLSTMDTSEFSAGPPAALAAVAGTPQNTTVATAYATPLQAQVTDAYGEHLSGIPVTFTISAGAAGGSFSGAASVIVVSDAKGLATAPTLTANNVSGGFAVTAAAGDASQGVFNLTNNP